MGSSAMNELLTIAERLERIVSLKGTLGYDSADVVELVLEYAKMLREQADEHERQFVLEQLGAEYA